MKSNTQVVFYRRLTYGLPKLLELFPNCKVYTNPYGKEALASAKKNLSLYYDNPIEIGESYVKEIEDGGEIVLFPGLKASVFETPGHNPSCLCFKVKDYLFTGDSYIPGLKVVTSLPEGDKQQAYFSLKRIQSLIDNSIVCAGHANI